MQNPSSARSVARGIVFTLVVNGLIPLLVYEILKGHVTNLMALSIATAIPMLENVVTLVRHRRIDVFGLFMLIAFLLGIAVLLMGGSEQLILLKESFVTAVMGVIFLGSLCLPRPLIFYFAIRFTTANDASAKSRFSSNWKYPYFRFVLRLMTAVWGVALLFEAGLRTFLVYHISTTAFLAVSSFITYGILGLTIVWTVAYRRRSKRKMEKILDASFAR